MIDAIDARRGGAALQLREQRLERLSITLRLELDGAVGQVAHPASKAESFGLAKDEEAKADALDAPADYGVEGGGSLSG